MNNETQCNLRELDSEIAKVLGWTRWPDQYGCIVMAEPGRTYAMLDQFPHYSTSDFYLIKHEIAIRGWSWRCEFLNKRYEDSVLMSASYSFEIRDARDEWIYPILLGCAEDTVEKVAGCKAFIQAMQNG